MIPILIGIGSGLLVIGFLLLQKKLDKRAIYGLILVGIGFLYVGFTWSDLSSLIICSIQALLFLFLAYWGMKKGLLILAVGYFLHGTWDLVYGFVDNTSLIPPGYDLFCLSIDFILGIYLVIFSKQIEATLKINLGFKPENIREH